MRARETGGLANADRTAGVMTGGPVLIRLPDPDLTLPLVFDSPHSGTHFPDDFTSLATAAELRTAWDAHVDDLWAGATTFGASLIAAGFPRALIDANRAPDDLDPALLNAPWPDAWGALSPTRYSQRGMGLIRRDILPGRPMHAGRLSPATVRDWITRYHAPYHAALSARIDTLHAQFGAVWHIDCHSMKSRANAMNIDHGAARPDIVLGDLDGQSASAGFSDLVARAFTDRGYSVARNAPYKGGYIVQRHGRPGAQRHSLQIEINRALYLDEARAEKSPAYAAFRQDLTDISQQLADYVRVQTGRAK
jgi:N-formylglutamate amidohydrolase